MNKSFIQIILLTVVVLVVQIFIPGFNFKNFNITADILIIALGKAEFVTADMVKDGVCIIDVGITRVKSDKTKSGWKLLGDVSYDEVKDKCSFITPVPGGVGPMTIAMLLKNTLIAAKSKSNS